MFDDGKQMVCTLISARLNWILRSVAPESLFLGTGSLETKGLQ